jgi:hypothetical protein
MAFKMSGPSLYKGTPLKQSPVPYKGVGTSGESIKNTKNKTLKTIKKYNPFEVFDKDNVYHEPAKKAAKAVYRGAKSVYKAGKKAYKSYKESQN